MILWVIVAIVLALIAFVYMKMEHQVRLVKVAFLSIVVILLVMSMIVMFNSGEVDLSSPGGVMSGIYLYIGWLGEFSVNLWDISVESTGRVMDAINVSSSASVTGRR